MRPNVSVARCGVFMPKWQFFNAYGGEKIVLGENGGIYGIKTINRTATFEWLRYEGKFSPIRDRVFLCTFEKW